MLTMPVVAQLGLALADERKDRRMRQRDVAALFRISQPSYSRWETGEAVPDEKRYRHVADFLHCTVGEVWQMIHDPEGLDMLIELRRRRKQRN